MIVLPILSYGALGLLGLVMILILFGAIKPTNKALFSLVAMSTISAVAGVAHHMVLRSEYQQSLVTAPGPTREVQSAVAGKCTIVQANERVSVSTCETGTIIYIK